MTQTVIQLMFLIINIGIITVIVAGVVVIAVLLIRYLYNNGKK